MREVVLFGEDYAHEQVVGTLVQRLAKESGHCVRLDWRNAVGGHGKVVRELRRYLADLKRQGGFPDLIVVATDANCSRLQKRVREVKSHVEELERFPHVVLAVPDPHIERWLLLDGAAFKAVFGTGCKAPDRKCGRGEYKQQLTESIRAAGREPLVGGIEFAKEIVQKMGIQTAVQADASFRHFVRDIRSVFERWGSA